MSTDHEQIRELLHAYVDGELDLVNSRATEQHLRSCDDCRRAEEQIRALRSAITNAGPAYRVPASLRRNIRASLRREAKSEEKTSSLWFLATAAACALLIVGAVLFQTGRTSTGDVLADQVIANHVRSLLATHLVDVGSSDQHTVKPWFEGKIDFAPTVTDFAPQGFPLVGGRLDYLDGRTIAALVYQRNKHPINVFIAPATTTHDLKPSLVSRRGYNVFHWTKDGMDYWAVSDLNQTELRQLTDLLDR